MTEPDCNPHQKLFLRTVQQFPERKREWGILGRVLGVVGAVSLFAVGVMVIAR